MNEHLKNFRAQYPDYGDMSDDELAKALHAKFYADMSYPEFAGKIGLESGFGGAGAGRSFEGTDTKTKLKTLGRAAAQAGTLGLADEIVGGIQGAFDPNKTVKQAIAAQRETDSLLQGANPRSSMAGSLLGMASLGPAVATMRGLHAAPAITGALPAQYGRVVPFVPPAAGGAMAMLRGLAKSPAIRSALGTATALEGLRRLF